MYRNELGKGSKYVRERVMKTYLQRMKDKISGGFIVQILISNSKSGLKYSKWKGTIFPPTFGWQLRKHLRFPQQYYQLLSSGYLLCARQRTMDFANVVSLIT